MSSKTVLENFDIDDSLKALAISLSRYIAEAPEFLFYLALTEKRDADNLSLLQNLFDELQDDEVEARFSKNIYQEANEYDWSAVEKAYSDWGRFGWIADTSLIGLGFWDKCPQTQAEADKLVLKKISKEALADLRETIQKESNNLRLFNEACVCFDNRCYTACASLLVTLIDGELIRSRANALFNNKKTGSNAGKRIIKEASKDDFYGLSGYFHLELLNFESYIDTLFERADNFKKEPNRINRNYLHHGMSKRKILRKDCIKLFMAYHKTVRFAKLYV